MSDLLALVRDALCAGIEDLTADVNCYVSALAAFLPGSSPYYVQVIDNGEQLEGDQGGGAFGRRISVRVAVFVHFALDQESRTQEALVRDSVGLRARSLAIRDVLNGSRLMDGPTPALQVPLYWTETAAAIAHPADPTWVEQDLVFVGYQYSRL